jgi:outer membrane protein OmpA-like peptidoglycan-associated protein
MFVAAVASAATLKLNKNEFSPGEEIRITVSATGETKEGAWIGIIPSNVPHGNSGVNDQHDLNYQYLSGKTSGTFTMPAPTEPGSYDIRLMAGGTSGDKELTSVTFKVLSVDYSPKLVLSKTALLPQEEIKVTFSVSHALPSGAWIGVIPSEIPHGSEATNDQHDVDYQYIGDKTTGTLTFAAPEKAGSYDFRLNDSDSNGHEISSVTFSVSQITLEGTLNLKRTSFVPGEQIEADFTASPTLPKNAWVGIIPSKVPHGKEAVNDQYDIQYSYLDKKASGKLLFVAPPDAGSYDLRMNSSDSDGVEITSVTFQVGGLLDAKGMSKLLSQQGRLALYGIQFDFNKATLKPESAKVLDQVAEVLKQDASLKLSIEGHTDNVGKPDYNLDLSKKRAESVKAYLVQTRGVDAGRLNTAGFGDTKPIAKNDTEAGRAQNRRVELVKQ